MPINVWLVSHFSFICSDLLQICFQYQKIVASDKCYSLLSYFVISVGEFMKENGKEWSRRHTIAKQVSCTQSNIKINKGVKK